MPTLPAEFKSIAVTIDGGAGIGRAIGFCGSGLPLNRLMISGRVRT